MTRQEAKEYFFKNIVVEIAHERIEPQPIIQNEEDYERVYKLGLQIYHIDPSFQNKVDRIVNNFLQLLQHFL